MFVPGSNLLNMALRHIKPQSPTMWRKFLSKTKNAQGIDVPTYAAAVEIVASVQAVQRTLYNQLGLDRQKKYVTIYTTTPLTDVERDGMGDMIEYGGVTYLVQSLTKWADQDGWSQGICIEVPAAYIAPTNPTPGVFT